MKGRYVQYGCGLSAPAEWINFDVSPTLRIQKVPVIGSLLRNKMTVRFPSNVRYGDIVTGLPVDDNSCDGVYCSHTLEHLSLQGFRKALENTYRILKPGGIFRCVVPDMEYAARLYLKALDNGDKEACIQFVRNTHMGLEEKKRGIKGLVRSVWGNVHHLWMWDHASFSNELGKVGFIQIRKCTFNDCEDKTFKFVEEQIRFENAVSIECRK